MAKKKIATLEEGAVAEIISERKQEWDTLVAQWAKSSAKLGELKEYLDSLLWERVYIIGSVCERFGDGALDNFIKSAKKAYGDKITHYQTRALKMMYYVFLHGEDRRFRELSYAHHILVVKQKDPFYWLRLARDKGMDAARLQAHLTKSLFMEAMIKRGKIVNYVNRFVDRFIVNDAALGVLLFNLSGIVKQRVDDEELVDILDRLERWGENRGKILLEDSEESKRVLDNITLELLERTRERKNG